jgi:23S rRNA pseudouridine2605 synthase
MEGVERKDTGIHQETVRLNRYLAMAGIGSRRKNDELIVSGAVKVNGKLVMKLGTQVQVAKDEISVHGEIINLEEKLVYIIFNKPKDTITTMSDEKGRTTVMKYVHVKQRVYPVGRLDRNTTGVLLFTNDGDLANALIHPKFEIEKLYRVTLDKQVSEEDLKKLRHGVRLEDGLAKVQTAEIIDGSKRQKVLLSLHEGRNREIRRIFEVIGYDVRQLDRISFAGLTPLGIPRGNWRFLNRNEINYLKKLTGSNNRKEIDEIYS